MLNDLKKKKLAFATFWILFTIVLLQYAFKKNEDWYSNTIPSPALALSDWEVGPLSTEELKLLNQLLSQSYHYLGEGGQSYVFVSDDRHYVLKLFKFHRFTSEPYIAYLPDVSFIQSFKEKHFFKRERRLRAVLSGHEIAYELNREASGLLFVQLKPSGIDREVTLHGKDGKLQMANLGRTPFVLQLMGEPLNEVFSSLFDQGQVSQVLEKIDKILLLYVTEFKKGMYDSDHGIMHNVGFVGEDPIHLDAGNFVYNATFKERAVYVKELTKVMHKIQLWVDIHYPKYSEDIAVHLQILEF